MTEAQRKRLEERKKRLQEEAAADAAASKRPQAKSLYDEYTDFMASRTQVSNAEKVAAKRPVPRRTTADMKPSGLVTRREESGKPTTSSNWSDRTTPKRQTPKRNPDYQEPRTFGERTDLARAAALPETSSSYRQLADWYNAESKKTDYQRAVEAEDRRVFEEGGYAALYERWLKQEQAKKNEGRKPATMMEWVPNERGEMMYTKVPISKPYSDPEYDKMRAEEVKDDRLADMGTMYGYVAEIAQMPTQAVLAIEKMAEAYNGTRSGKYTEQDIARINAEAATTLRVVLGDRYDDAHVGDLVVALSRYRNMTDEQKAQEEYARRLQAGESGTFGENLASFGQNFMGGITGAGAALGDAIGGLLGMTEYHHMDPNDAAHAAARTAQRTRSLTASSIEGEDPDFIRKAGSYLYQGAMSAGDNIIRAAAGMVTGIPGLSLALAGASSFGQGYQEAASRGGNRLQATLYGAATGGLEIVTEKLPLDRLLQVPEEGLKNAIADILTSAAIEVGEEEASYFGGMIADAIIMGKNSENQIRLRELMAEGKTEDEAWDILLKEILQEATDTAITSALSSGIMTGGKYAIFGGSQSDTAEPDKITDDITSKVNEETTGGPVTEETPEVPAEGSTPETTQKAQQRKDQKPGGEYSTMQEAAATIDTRQRTKFEQLYDGQSDLTRYAKGWQAMVLEGKRSVRNPDVKFQDARTRWSSFTDAMSEDAAMTAFAYGQTSAQADKKPLTAGKVTFDGDETRLTPWQKTNMAGLRLVAEALNVPIAVFESDTSPKTGSRIGANGWYDPKDGSIHIDLNAGVDGAGTMLYTASHELVHMIRDRAPGDYSRLSDFLSREIGSDFDTLVAAQIEKARNSGRTIDRDTAYEEVVADAMEAMLTDKDVVRKLERLRDKDKNLWKRLKTFFSNLASRIRKAYKGLSPDSKEGKMVKSMLDKADELKKLFVGGLEWAAATSKNQSYESQNKQTKQPGQNPSVDSKGRSLTEEQIKFFRKSVIRDKSGKLLPVYHGSGSFFSEFSFNFVGKSGLFEGLGFYFTDSKAVADRYSTGPEGKRGTEKGTVYEVYLNVAKPLSSSKVTMTRDEYIGFLTALEAEGITDPSFGTVSEKRWDKLYREAKSDRELFALSVEYGRPEAADRFLRILQYTTGYDGLITEKPGWGGEQTVYLAFFPDQIKLVSNKTPTHSKDIRYSYAGERAGTADGDTAQRRNLTAEKRKKTPPDLGDEKTVFADDSGVKYSVRDEFADELDRWDGKTDKTFLVGTTSDLLVSLGAKSTRVVWHSKKIAKTLRDHPGMTRNILKQVPMLLENPIAILSSKSVDSRLIAMGTLKDADGKPVLAVLELQPTNKGGQVMDFSVVASSYGKDSAANFVRNSGIVYLNKKRTKGWLQGLGLQLPSDTTKLGSVGRITYPDGKVKIESTPFSKLFPDVRYSMRDNDEPDFTMSDGYDFSMSDGVDFTMSGEEGYVMPEEAPVTEGTEGTEGTPAEKPRKESKPLHNLTRIQRAIKPIAERIKTKAGANGNTDELRRLIEQAYSDIARKKAPTMEDIQAAAEPAAQWVMEHTPAQLDPYAEAALAEMKGRTVKLNDGQRAEIVSQYGSIAAFKKALGSAVKISEEGLPLDVFFQEMAESFPGLFDQTVSDAQMGLELADLIDQLQNMESTDSAEASYYAEEIKADIVQQILDGYEETDVLKAVKERHRKEVAKLRQQQKDRVKKLRGEHRAKLAEERAKADKKVAATEKRAFDEIAHKEERLARAEALVKGFREQQETYGLRSTVYREARSLIRKLNENSKGQHVPAPLRKVLGEFAASLDLLSKASHTKGELTKADNRMVASMEKLRGMLTTADSAEAKAFGNFVSIDGVILDIAPEVVGQLTPIIDNINQALRQWSESGNEGNALYSMNKKQLDTLHEVLTQILTAVGNANTIFSGEAGRRTDVYAKRAIREYDSMKVAKNEHAIDWNLMTPFFFFKRMGGAAAHIWEGFKEGMNKMARLRKQVEDFSRKTWKPKEIKAWQKKIITYKTEAGEEIQLTEAQVMSLYIASKREQAQLHMFDRGDGIQIGEIKQTGKANIVDKQNHKITPQDVANLVDMLSDKKRQLEVADAIQEFMSMVGAKLGNEVTLKRWGIKRFGEKYYFPIKVVSGSKDVQADKIRNELYRLLNLGMTKDTKEGVTEAMIIDGIFDVFADHMSEMIRYNSFALPILDAMRWVNFTDRVSDEQGGTKKGQSVHGAMEKAFGKKSVKFFLDMVGALNSNKTGENDPTDKVTRFLNAMWKRSVIFHSLSTAVKQPLSYIRASYVLSPKYMTKAFGKIPDSKMKQEREQMYRENGIAEWKGQGYMDANMSRGMSDAFKQERTFGQRWEDSAMWLASKMDELTWTRLWIACKWQACKGDPKLYGVAETLAEARRLFEDAIYGTQVVDSPLTRSQWSRNNNLFNSMFVPFSSEGNVAYNVMMDGVRLYGDEVRRTDRKTAAKKYGGKIARGISVYMVGQVADAIVESLIAAHRDDDEFKTYWEKFMEALLGEGVMQGDMLGLLGGNLFDSLNPLNNMANLQVITDSILSATKGYSNERTDTATLVKLIELGKMWYEYAGIKNGTIEEPTKLTGYGRKTMEGMMYDTLRTLDRVFGTGVGNIARTVVTAYNNVVDVYNRTREPGEKKAERFIRYDGFTENAVKQAYEDGYLSLQEAGKQIQEARVHNDKPEYTDNELYWVLKKLETGLSRDDGIDLAVLSGNRDSMKDAQSEIIEFSDKAPKNPLQSSILRVYKDSLKPEKERNKAYNGQTISRDTAYKLLTEVAGLADREAFKALEEAEYAVENGDTTGYSVYSGVYNSVVSGDTESFQKEMDRLTEEGYLSDEVLSDVRGMVTSAYKDGKLSKSQVTKILGQFWDVTEQKELYVYFDKAEYETEYGESYTPYRNVYKAVASGSSIDEAMKHLTANGFTEKEVREQAVDYLHKQYKNGEVSETKTAELLHKYGRTTAELSEKEKRAYFKEYGKIPKDGEIRYLTENERFWKMDEWTWKKENPDGEYQKYSKWYDATESGDSKTIRETIKYYEEHGVDKSTLSDRLTDKYKNPYVEAMLSGDRETARAIRRWLIKAYGYLGQSSDEVLKQIQEWVSEEKKNRR